MRTMPPDRARLTQLTQEAPEEIRAVRDAEDAAKSGGPAAVSKRSERTVIARIIMSKLERPAQRTPPELEVLDVASRPGFDRWEDDGGREAPTNAALTITQHHGPSGQTRRPQESGAFACLEDDLASARDTHTGDGS